MQSETDWLNQAEAQQEAYRYFMRPDPDMREMLGPIEKTFDELTGREMRSRLAKVSMMRGQAEENMKQTRVYLDPLPHIRLEKAKDLQGWYSSKGDGAIKGMRERPCMTDAILTQPYGGWCHVGCGFCYVNSGTRGYRGTGLASVPIGYGDHVKRQLSKMRVANAGYFSSFIDPFLPIEDFYHNTQRGAEAFISEGLPIFFLSRLRYPGWAFDLLLKNGFSYAQMSINTPHEDDWRKLSPGAIPLDEHMAQIAELRRKGVYVSIQCNPVIAGIVTHEDIELLFERLAEAGANHVIVKFVEANFPWAGAMVQKMTKAFGENRSAVFRDLFTENSAGQQKTVQEEYRMEGHRRYQARATKLGMTYASCYEYAKKDGRFVSIGREVLTADQCHGHRVPMYERRAPGAPFTEVAECPPSGCLHCADDNGGEPRCGSTLLGAAKALRQPDFRKAAR